MKSTVKISTSELKDILFAWNFGAQPVSANIVTKPKMTAIGKELFGEITQISALQGMVGYVYENSVNNQLEREQMEREFIAQPLWNGAGKRVNTAMSSRVEKIVVQTKRTKNGIVIQPEITKEGQTFFYLTFKKDKTLKTYSFDINMNLLTKEQLAIALVPPSPSYQGGIEKKINHREIHIENVKKLKFRKTTYVIE